MKAMLLVLLFVGTRVLAGDYADQLKGVPLLHYHDDFRDYYPRLFHSYEFDGLPVVEPVIVLDSFKTMKATIRRTNGGLVPYDKSRCNITIEGVDVEPLHVSAKEFRTIDVEWVGSNLLYFDINIGHIASVECLLDVRGKKWLYTKSISFNKFSDLTITTGEPGASTDDVAK